MNLRDIVWLLCVSMVTDVSVWRVTVARTAVSLTSASSPSVPAMPSVGIWRTALSVRGE